MTAIKEKFVTLDYHFTSPDGTLLGSSSHSGPLSFQLGVGEVIEGLDIHLEGHEEGENLVFVIPPEQAYGQKDETLIKVTNLKELSLKKAEVGDRVQVQFDSKWLDAYISEVNGEVITVDANHPLAGVPLHFDCSLLSVSDTAPAHDCSGGCGGCGGGCDTH